MSLFLRITLACMLLTIASLNVYSQISTTYEFESLTPTVSSGDRLNTFGLGTGSDPQLSGGYAVMLEANGLGDFVTYKVAVPKTENCSVRLGVKKLANRGTFQLAVDGVNCGAPQDLYASSEAYVELDLCAFSAAAAGEKILTFTVTGKNALSTGYLVALDYIKLVHGNDSSVVIAVDADRNGEPVSQTLMGIFFEELRGAINGGLYPERVLNRSFEYSTHDGAGYDSPLTGWSLVTRGGGSATIRIDSTTPLNKNNPHYLSLAIQNPGSGVGVKNTGFRGMKMTKGETYYFSFHARRDQNLDAPFDIRIESPTGELYGHVQIPAITGTWAKYTDSLVATVDDTSAQLVVLATGSGTVQMDMISLFPKATYKNRPNGLRPDMVQMLADLKPGFFRFPGGCIVHGDGLANAYRWKESIGDVAERRENWNCWGGANHQVLGLGYFEYFQLCEDIGATPVPVLPIGMSCQFRMFELVPLDQMGPWIQDILDLVEFANGPATSTWGSKRAAMGHPEPFNMEYIGLGNEEKINEDFRQRFALCYDAVKKAYPDLKVVGTSGAGPAGGEFDLGWTIAQDLDLPVVDEHFYEDASWFIKAARRYDRYDRNGPKVMVGEYAAHTKSTWRGALGDAAFTTGLERNGGVVEFSCYGPGAALYTFNKDSIMLKGTFHEEKMFAENLADTNLVFTASATSDSVCISAGKDTETGDVILKIVNATGKDFAALIQLNGVPSVGNSAKAIVLTGSTDAIYLEPTEKTIAAGISFTYDVPAFSFTVLRIPTARTAVSRHQRNVARDDIAIKLLGQVIRLPSEFRGQPIRIELFDLAGRMVRRMELPAGQRSLQGQPLSQLPGMYMVKCSTRHSVAKRKFIQVK